MKILKNKTYNKLVRGFDAYKKKYHELFDEHISSLYGIREMVRYTEDIVQERTKQEMELNIQEQL